MTVLWLQMRLHRNVKGILEGQQNHRIRDPPNIILDTKIIYLSALAQSLWPKVSCVFFFQMATHNARMHNLHSDSSGFSFCVENGQHSG